MTPLPSKSTKQPKRKLKSYIDEDKEGNKKVNHILLSEYILEQHKIIRFTSTVSRKKTFYIFEDGYKEIKECEIKNLIILELDSWHNSRLTKECFEYLIPHIKHIEQERFYNLTIDLIPVRNGLCNWMTGELLKYDEKYYHDYKLNVEYDKEATCEDYQKFLKFFLGDDYKTFIQFCALCIYEKNPIPTILFLLGSGGDGKSTALSAITKMLGTRVLGYDLKQLVKNRFVGANLFGKSANINPDDKTDEEAPLENLKGYSGNDMKSLELKGVQLPVNAIMGVKFAFAFNKKPQISEISDATKRRIIPLQIKVKKEDTRNFIKNNFGAHYIQETHFDKDMSGFFNILIEELAEIVGGSQQELYLCESSKKYKEYWFYDNDLIQQFLDEHTTECESDEAFNTVKEFTTQFKIYFDKQGYSSQKMKAELLDKGIVIKQKKINGIPNKNAIFGRKLIKKI